MWGRDRGDCAAVQVKMMVAWAGSRGRMGNAAEFEGLVGDREDEI